MFGYILPDKPNMYMKDYTFYRSFYCGLCKGTGCKYGCLARLGVNYDATFIDILLHGVQVTDYEYKQEGCIIDPFRKKAVLKTNPISEKVAAFNILLMDFKGKDDRRDEKVGIKRLAARLFKRKAKKARKELPEIASILDKAAIRQEEAERTVGLSVDRLADPFASAMQNSVKVLAAEAYSEELGRIVYDLGKFIYVMDGIDDFEDDLKKGRFNPFKAQYPEAVTKAQLLESGDDLSFLVEATIDNITENYKHLKVFGTEGIITNTFWYGLRARADKVMDKECKKCQKIRF